MYLFLFFCSFCFAEVNKIAIDKSKIVFGDGDTFSFTTEASTSPVILRFLGVDTPEIGHEKGFFKESQYLGQEASEFTKQQILAAKTVEYVPYKSDYYGRTLAYIFVDGELLAARIIKAGLGFETVSMYAKKNADQNDELKAFGLTIKQIADDVGRPNFQNPLFWRQKYRRKHSSGVKKNTKTRSSKKIKPRKSRKNK